MSARILVFIVLRLHWSLIDLAPEDERWRALSDAPAATEIAQVLEVA